MKLNDLKPNEGKVTSRKRVGRGISAGQGKSAGRGTKGQGSRQGGSVRLYHQGGNLPFFRRLPFMRGFTPLHKLSYNEINLDQLSASFQAESQVNPDSLFEANLLREPENPIVLLGRGEVNVPLRVYVHRASKKAIEKIESAGGSVTILPW